MSLFYTTTEGSLGGLASLGGNVRVRSDWLETVYPGSSFPSSRTFTSRSLAHYYSDYY